jgi:DNA-binding NarL/FixJ family response regulator
VVREDRADVIVLDISMPEQNGVDALAAIRARAPKLPVLVFSSFPEEHYAMTLLRQGASGYLSKECDPQELLRAIRTVSTGRAYVSGRIAAQLVQGLAGAGAQTAHDLLSERELQVFLRLARGQTVGQIARGVSLSAKTVSTYRSRILAKLQLHSNSDLTYYALKHGLIQ